MSAVSQRICETAGAGLAARAADVAKAGRGRYDFRHFRRINADDLETVTEQGLTCAAGRTAQFGEPRRGPPAIATSPGFPPFSARRGSPRRAADAGP